jgi:dienelactone hydrolase
MAWVQRLDAACDTMKRDFAPLRWVREGYAANAGWFGPEYRARFGWLYTPDRANNSIGIVIVPPFGRDETCAHRTLRHLAEIGARRGFITMRFDLDGCGDSAGGDSDPDRVDCWITSVHDACDCVRRAGAANVVLIGVCLGATLAALAALQRKDVTALVAFNPVVRGRRWLHELRALKGAMSLPPSPSAMEEEGLEASGFWLSRETCGTLAGIDLTRVAAPARHVLLLERDDLPDSARWGDHLRAEGCKVGQRRIAGFADMMADPHLNGVAQAFIDACMAYMSGMRWPEVPEPAKRTPPLHPSLTVRVGNTFIEEVAVSPGAGIFGILAKPLDARPDRALLVLNAGAVHHIGVGRFDVDFARRMAASGMQVLRIDLTGIGDSATRVGAIENATYGTGAIEDVGICVDWLRARGVRRLIVGGMCSGACHALCATIAGQAIDAVYLVNCGVFVPNPAFGSAAYRRFSDIAHYNKTLKSARAWRKLLGGRANMSRIARAAAWKIAFRGGGALLGAARRVGLRLHGDLGRDFAGLVRRGVKVHFLYSGNDPGLIRLAVEAGSLVPKYIRAGHFSMRSFEGANHTFTQRWAQAALLLALRQIMKKPAIPRILAVHGVQSGAAPQRPH